MENSFAEKLAAARSRVARLRSEVFVDYTPRVCGIDLEPLSLKSYSRLLAFESPFLWGGPIALEDIAVFVWVHRPEFGQHAVVARRRIFRRVAASIEPRFPRCNAVGHLLLGLLQAQLPRSRNWSLRRLAAKALQSWLRPPLSVGYDSAVSEIRRLVAEALLDFPKSLDAENEDAGRQLPAQGPSVAMQAHFINTLVRDLGLRPIEIETMPLRRAIQHYRDCLVSKGVKGLALLHPEEAQVWREELIAA